MNKVILMGRCTKDPEVRWSQGEKSTAIGRITLAVDRNLSRMDSQRQIISIVLRLVKEQSFLKNIAKGNKACN